MCDFLSKGQTEKASASPQIPIKTKCIFIISTLIVLFIFSLHLYSEWRRYQDQASSEAIQLGQSLETLLPPQLTEALLGSVYNVEQPEYIIAKNSLMRLVDTTNLIRFAYLMREQNGNLVFLIDSESPESPNYSPPGQVYEEAKDLDWEPFRTGETVITPPLSDRWGTWVSVLVPIKDPESGETVAIFGIDYDAAEWYATLWKQMIPNIAIVFVVLLLYFSLLYIWNQRSRLNRLNEKLAFDEAFYHSVFNQAPIGIAVVEGKSFIFRTEFGDMTINPTYEKILGRSKDDLCNVTWAEITHTEDLAADIEKFDQFKKGEIPGYIMEKRFIKPDGSVVWTNMSVSSLFGVYDDYSMHLCLIEDISERKQAALTLQERIKLEMAIADASRLFVFQDQLNINEVLKIIGETVSVNRSYVFRLTENGQKMDNLYEWCSHNTEPQIDMLQGLDSAMFPWWMKQFQSGNNIIFSDIENLPPEAVGEKNILQEQDIKSIFVAPILSTYGTLTGFIGFDDTEKHREWSDEDAKTLRVIAEMIGMYWDRKNSENQLKELLENTQSMINNHEAVMLLIEPLSGNIIEANSAATSFYGYSKEELINMFIHDINILDKDEVAALRIKALDKGQKYFTFPHRLKNGEIRMVDAYSSPINYSGKKVLFSIIFDVTKREEIAKENEYLAYHDYLTGLYNRRFFEEEYERRVKRGEFPVALLLGDIDGFKVYNDSFGHAEGDRVLKAVATRINELINDKDVLTRIGGDEFAIIISGKNEGEIRQYLDKLERASYNSVEFITEETPLNISWGYAVQRNKEDTIDALNEEAEAFMYNRKFYSHKSARSKTVNVIMRTLFTKSDREKKHSERVGKLCESIAKKMHLSQEEVDKVRVAGLLHDIGKIGIDENILNKAGKLDAKEWELMKLHPAKGSSILENTIEYHDISNTVLSHHERYDGTGYPRGLKAKSIPLWARIISVADAFDVMTNVRPYHHAVSNEEAISELKKCSGTQFDPEIVSVFINEAIGS
ncbi:MAG: diguanylate cyclase [Clostridia bacterium]|nr:diguanylate cyclase [Clostridia bacterium]